MRTHIEAEGMLRRFTGGTPRSRHLVCFPHAGAPDYVYRSWAAPLGSHFQVWGASIRGRELDNEPERRWRVLVERFADALMGFEGDITVYGHSLGTLMAYETARELDRRGREVTRLVVSGRVAPHVRLHYELPTDPVELARAVAARYGGVPAEVLAEPEMLELVGRTMSEDFTLHTHYRWEPGSRLSVPLTAIGGVDDPVITEEGLRAWGEHTSGPFTELTIPGGHFPGPDELPLLFDAVRTGTG
ncbi:thioesterase II family protein [Marinactinospora thermotolerans]|uniref:Surfactin synthase thioesterase subunit n=1 Tax=Marinactinospora thermotolerans DSM 45154 TaxID=1122192 RepID=A0A1T4RRX2_9ACTN|nr:thioesterase domain-containing protein [Marinactinospora thermotolerans]SKA18576.1 Surfactin synthase thioesterase subunit [Marinactinospora thermotolerans DSM 45154]